MSREIEFPHLNLIRGVWLSFQDWLDYHKLPSKNRRVRIRVDPDSPLVRRIDASRTVKLLGAKVCSDRNQDKTKPPKNSPLVTRNIIVYPGWDLVIRRWTGTLIGLDRESERYYESYALENKFVQATRHRLIFRRDSHDVVRKTIPKAIVLVGSNMNQWGHCVQDLLFRFLAVPDSYHDWPILVQEDTPPNFVAAFREVFGNREFIFATTGQAIRVRRAVVPLPRTRTPVGWKRGVELYSDLRGWIVDGPDISALRRRLSKRRQPLPPGELFCYLARRDSANRTLLNGSAVQSIFEDFGFKVIYPEDFEIHHLLRILDNSLLIAGVAGSQLLNLIFMTRSIEALILRNPFQPKGIFNKALEWAGHSVSDIQGTICVEQADCSEFQKAQQSFFVSEELLRKTLTQLASKYLPSNNRDL